MITLEDLQKRKIKNNPKAFEWSPEKRKEMEDYAAQGMQMKEVAEKMGCSESTLYRKGFNLRVMRKEVKLEATFAELVEMVEAGMTQKMMAEKLEVSHARLASYLREKGVRIRDIKRAQVARRLSRMIIEE